MAASRADVDLTVRALNGLSTAARAEFVREWSSLDLADRAAVQRVLMRFWPELIGKYGDMAAALAGDVFELQADDLGIEPRTELVRPVDEERANARARWALTTPDALGNFLVLLDELVKQPYRSSFARSAEASGAGWARVPRGSETCAFCLMLGSRGAVYHTSRTAGRGRKYHGECDCAIVLVRDERDYPEGYDPDDLYQRYLNARAESKSDSTSSILSSLRAAEGTN